MHSHLIPRNLFVGNRIPLAGVSASERHDSIRPRPKTSALDANCKAHEVDNLYVVDGSFFPSSGAVIRADDYGERAPRGDRILERLGATAAVPAEVMQ